MMRRYVVAAGIAFALMEAAPAPAQDTVAERQALVAERIAREVIAPRYDQLAAAMEAQASAWRTACGRAQAEASHRALNAAFTRAADAWASVEFVRYGPIAQDLRYERFAHWPERRNAVERSLNALLTALEPPSRERLRGSSVAGQGLTALERLLFGGDGKSPNIKNTRACATGLAIADNLASIAGAVSPVWAARATSSQRPAEAKQELARLVTDALTALEVVAEVKLGLPLGKDADTARPLTAESWRAGRSIRTIALNLQAVADFSEAALKDGADPALAGSILRAAQAALAQARQLESRDLRQLVADPRGRRELVLLRDLVTSLRTMLETELPAQLGITIGFNSRDGD